MSQTNEAKTNHKVGLVFTTALASLTLAGCTANVAPPAQASNAQAEKALAKGKSAKAIEHAEAAVLATPRNADSRALLGAAYIEAGRFASAATTLAEAVELGDTSSRTIIGLALSQIAAGQQDYALATLQRHGKTVDKADLGLALALAGRPAEGVHVLGNVLRSGQNTMKVRQNLAYSLALQGNWRGARLMAAEDVPADKLGQRMSRWAVLAAPDMYTHRVADLLGVGISRDPGQPAMLALSNHPSVDQLAAELVEETPVAPVQETSELPAMAVAPTVAEDAPNEPATASEDSASRTPTVKFVSNEVVQQVPTTAARSVSAPAVRVASRVAGKAEPDATKTAPKVVIKSGDFRVQLGSYFSMSDAQAAWKLFVKRYPELSDTAKVITKAKVNGKMYYRVAAAGFAKSSAQDMCRQVKRGGAGCIAYAESNPLPGTIEDNVRIASR